ncbi:MAG TPA: response regulator, partial [Candidatus Pullilachnospira stercoravium]|nr:response regulator [Candidatus Pullilachnospira stercoravium]
MQFIAICEDQPEELSALSRLLDETLPEFFPNYRIMGYSSGLELMETLRQESEIPSLLFLDIYLKDTTGIQIAQYIRSQGFDIQIIFLTSSREFIMESYDLNVLYYIVKPLDR